MKVTQKQKGDFRMLVLSRNVDEKINIGPDIEVMVISVARNKKVRIGINAPEDVNIVRSELKNKFTRQPVLPGMDGSNQVELGGDDFNNKDTEILSEIIAEALADRGIQTEGFAFAVHAYLPK